ncbi:MAG: DNA helicase RecQ [Robiginitomaculum sp.]
MLDTLKDTFGFDDFRANQRAPIEALLRGESVFCVMPTGAGKSMIYQLPALVGNGLTIVISPLIALMNDQVSALKILGVKASSLNSTKTPEENAQVWDDIKSGSLRLLYLAPERLMQTGMLDALSRYTINLIAIDEAHCISQWGPSFRPEYEMLMDLGAHFPNAPIAALTASADKATRQDIVQKLFNGSVHEFLSGFDRPNISLTVNPKTAWKQQLLNFVKTHKAQSGIVYCLSRKKTETAAQALTAAGFAALTYHAGMGKTDRDANQKRFVRDPNIIMCATIAFGMGIDKPDVRFVFHTDMPGSMEAYYQEFGRAGRDGDPADAFMLYGMADIQMRRQFIEQGSDREEQRRREHKRLDALISYCEAPTCRRQTLLAYFSDASEPCKNCDVCLDPVTLKDGTTEGRMALSAIVRTGQVFGAAHIVNLLMGANTERLRKFGHDKLPTWGVGKAHTKNQWRSIIRQLVASGFLHLDIAKYGGLSLTSKGGILLKGEDSFAYKPLPASLIAPLAASITTSLTTSLTTSMASKVKKVERASKIPIDESPLDDLSMALFEKLRSVRIQIARENKVPAYVIFHDKTLREMARMQPQSLSAMSTLHGVGKSKLDKFGADFLKVLQNGYRKH